MHIDTSINSNRIRSDYTDTYDLMVTKALGDLIPFLDRYIEFFDFYEKIVVMKNIKIFLRTKIS